MKLSLETRDLARARADMLVVGRHAGEARLGPALQALDAVLGGTLSRVLAAEKFEGKPGQSSHFYTDGRLAAPRVLVVGLGQKNEASAEAVRRAAAHGARRARDLGAVSAAMFLPGEGVPPRQRAQAAAEGAILGSYRFDKYLTEKNGKALGAVAVVEPDRRQQALAREGVRLGEIWAQATCAARDLVNEPANLVTPTYLAGRAEEIARAGRLKVRVLERDACATLGMGAFVGVARGSQEPPKFIHLTYAPRGRARKRVALIGKGITFDSGGLDLKTADGMLRMKDDMSGAAAVLAVFQALPRLRLPLEVHGLIAATENMPSGTAQRPGDIVRAMNGLTIEIGNTDAEGRLTLADALAYAATEIEPDEMIDMATLTGAVVMALGLGLSGVLGSQDATTERVLAAADAAGERMWRLPLHEEYKDGLKSDVADLNNISSQRGGGAIVAALFMREFTGGIPWVHLDIAGTAFTEKELPLGPKGGTGVAVRTLLTYLMRLAGKR
ncbi:MAG: leucyl aminopeptidase [Candidatus Rokubacteria bacterium]|nr:leucyl aminopeptidase [Candidatus Rokubacteria bacterium]MBI3106431.1 leucyl aminopeptidase [Candidatus Rokubacteria bacterium]